jgi:hypothetical protein
MRWVWAPAAVGDSDQTAARAAEKERGPRTEVGEVGEVGEAGEEEVVGAWAVAGFEVRAEAGRPPAAHAVPTARRRAAMR